MFNALKYSQELQKAGFSREQAEASVNLLVDVMDQNFATKADLKDLEHRMDIRFSDLKSEMDLRFSKVESKFQELEYKLTIKLGAMLTVAVGAIATLNKVL